MRQLFPVPLGDVDPLEIYDEPRRSTSNRPWTVTDMVVSVDGATVVAGRSKGLGGPADRAVFRALRAVPDVVLVGAGTARIEHYGPVQLDTEVQARRQARGQTPVPRLALVSGRLDLDTSSPLFTEATVSPLVITARSAPADRLRALDGVAEVVVSGSDAVDLSGAMVQLRQMGVEVVLCEGGPHLNGQLVGADLVDEWCQTTAPLLAAGDSARAAAGPEPDPPVAMELHRVLEADGYLFTTHRRAGSRTVEEAEAVGDPE